MPDCEVNLRTSEAAEEVIPIERFMVTEPWQIVLQDVLVFKALERLVIDSNLQPRVFLHVCVQLACHVQHGLPVVSYYVTKTEQIVRSP
jgi:hypothetical protein